MFHSVKIHARNIRKKKTSGMLEKQDSLIHYRSGGKSEQLIQTCPVIQAVPEFYGI